MRQGRWRGGSRLHWIRCHRRSVALRWPPLLYRRRPPPMSSLPHQMSSTSLTMPASRWPGSLPTDGSLRFLSCKCITHGFVYDSLLDKRRIIFQLSSIISVLTSSPLWLVGDTADK